MPPVDHHIAAKEHWRSPEHWADTPEVREWAASEFKDYDPEEIRSMSRRRFLQLMGASMALAGVTMTGCRRWPEDQIVPHGERPEGHKPGEHVQYATLFEMSGVATGVLATCFDGRPIKIEGNPLHPISKGATDAFMQASILEMYDPDRKASVMQRGIDGLEAKSWSRFDSFAGRHFEALRENDGAGLAILTEASSSPTLHRLRRELAGAMPQARWHEYEPISRDRELAGAKQAFGSELRAQYHLDQAEVIVSLGGDLLGQHPAKLKHARDWAAGRRAADERGVMNRLFVAETDYSITGSVADHRLPATPSTIARVAAALAGEAAELDEAATTFVEAIRAELKSRGQRCVVIPGAEQSADVHALCHRINQQSGAIGRAVTFIDEPDADRLPHVGSIRALTDAISAGDVKTLLILGGNPAYNAPADVNFADALGQVETSIRLGDYLDETSQRCTWHLPRAHGLESWGDGRAWDGAASIQQPMILPLYEGRSSIELLAGLLGKTQADGQSLVKRTWSDALGGGSFLKAWRDVLHEGVVPGTAAAARSVEVAVAGAAIAITPSSEMGHELLIAPSPHVYDGRFGNNAWLHETPHPLSKVTWDNAVHMSTEDAAAMRIATHDVVKLTGAMGEVELPVYVMPGHASGAVSVTLGYGRTDAGGVGNGVGVDTYRLFDTAAMTGLTSVRVERTGRTYNLATTQNHHLIDEVGFEGRQKRIGKKGDSGYLVKDAPVEKYHEEPHFVHKDEHGNLSLQLFEPPHEFNEPHAWGMAVDMNSCIGCNACVVACQSENNIPVVGREQVERGREMHWIRIDRYFKGKPDDPNPEMVYQPMMCVHCENAPCEQVCPVAATVHDTEGLNTMVYNRCIGTRYCSNNCPYKVRRFNYFDYHAKGARDNNPNAPVENWHDIPDKEQLSVIDEIRQMAYNPDVTVRMRGVMEKCTFCTQRIQSAKIHARNEYMQGERDSDLVQDGEVVTACQSVCPTEAIVFGNLNDPSSKVAKLHKNNRAYGVLQNLNTRPRVLHLAKLRNPSDLVTDQKMFSDATKSREQ